jgi:hypothetical protein
MINPQLTFATEAAAIAAEKQIWINKVKARSLEGANLVGDGATHYSDLSGLTDDQIAQLTVYSGHNGDIDPSLTPTVKYAEIQKAHLLSKWFFPQPGAEFMTGVVGSSVEEYDEAWEEPII